MKIISKFDLILLCLTHTFVTFCFCAYRLGHASWYLLRRHRSCCATERLYGGFWYLRWWDAVKRAGGVGLSQNVRLFGLLESSAIGQETKDSRHTGVNWLIIECVVVVLWTNESTTTNSLQLQPTVYQLPTNIRPSIKLIIQTLI